MLWLERTQRRPSLPDGVEQARQGCDYSRPMHNYCAGCGISGVYRQEGILTIHDDHSHRKSGYGASLTPERLQPAGVLQSGAVVPNAVQPNRAHADFPFEHGLVNGLSRRQVARVVSTSWIERHDLTDKSPGQFADASSDGLDAHQALRSGITTASFQVSSSRDQFSGSLVGNVDLLLCCRFHLMTSEQVFHPDLRSDGSYGANLVDTDERQGTQSLKCGTDGLLRFPEPSSELIGTHRRVHQNGSIDVLGLLVQPYCVEQRIPLGRAPC